MRLLTKVAVSAVYVLAVGGASTGATAFGVHLATRSPLASATTARSDFQAGTPPGPEAPDNQDTTGIDGERAHEASTSRSRGGTSTLTVNGISHRPRTTNGRQGISLTRH
jgi:hypothetical protein